GRLSPEYKRRAVQGYSDSGEPGGEDGSEESYYHWPGTGQMYSSARDMAVFLAANLGEVPVDRSLREAMNLAHQDVWIIGPRSRQALAWEVLGGDAPTITEKYRGLPKASAYIGMILRRQPRITSLGKPRQ